MGNSILGRRSSQDLEPLLFVFIEWGEYQHVSSALVTTL